jgi:hypothetical protein
MKAKLNILLLVLFAAGSHLCIGGLMRKNDQATILAGANDLAHNRFRDPSVYYQVDKTYVLYGVCAALIKCAPPDVDPIAVANTGLALIFWSALFVFVIRFRRRLEPLALLCFLSAPAVLFNTVYVNSSVLSSAFLLLSAAFLMNEEKRGGWLAALLFFLAVGSRVDVILLLPLILWLTAPFPTIGEFLDRFSKGWKKGMAGLTLFSNGWKLIGAGILALAAGRLICRSGGAAFDPIFNWKMVAGYTTFGFGAAGLLFALYLIELISPLMSRKGVLERIHQLAGIAAFLLPVLFFIPQLHAPRYFWRGCEVLLLLPVSGRVPVLRARGVRTVVVLAATVPLFVGIRLPALNRPQMTMAQPTLFPSGDGFYPMGGYLPYLFRLRNANARPVDHNQLVWSAVHSAQFDFTPDGKIPVLWTPMYGYFLLEASLRGGDAQCLSLATIGDQTFYADSRSLMRDDPKTPLGDLPQILSIPSRFVSPVSAGVGVLKFGDGDDQWGRQTRLLNRLFCGNEYRILAPGSVPDASRRAVFFSKEFFAGSERDAGSGLYYSGGKVCQESTPVFCAEAVFPDWMSLQTFSSR